MADIGAHERRDGLNAGTLPPGEPRVTTTFFDAVVDVTSMEVRNTGVSADAAICMDQRGDATCRALDDLGGADGFLLCWRSR